VPATFENTKILQVKKRMRRKKKEHKSIKERRWRERKGRRNDY
jgi:hypothetical protein